MTDELARALRDQRRAAVRARMKRITSGLGNDDPASAEDAPASRSDRLVPAEHWRPAGEGPESLVQAPAVEEAGGPPTEGEALREAPPPLPPEGEAPPEAPPQAGAGRVQAARTASWLDRGLVAIEVLAIVALVGATFLSFGILDRLRTDAAAFSAFSPRGAGPTPTVQTPSPRAPTATAAPSPTLRPWEALLPGGRTEPTRDASEPASAATRSATPISPTGMRLIIPAIGVNAPLVEGDDWEALKAGIGHRIGSAWPGAAGNVVVSAHSDIYAAIFKKLSLLRPGDLVLADTPTGGFHYEVVSSQIVLPTETSVMDPTSEPILTMITCYPPLVDTHRLVVTARLVE